MSWIKRLRGRWRREGSRRDAAHRLYAAAVEQSRQPTFYAAWGVPDSREGRLEMLNLHAMLLMRRLRSEGEEGRAVAQALFDLMFLDLDRHLREWGVGDLSIGKHVKKLAQSFFGRAAALDPLLSSRDAAGIEDVLRRNVYTDAASPPPAAIGRL
ncbi:MAG TPA: ubiquinol-cytochrome C chaperone family protein, partial [Gaiellales bacterium]|nr:ubiquinol-cytochrome C chaperone family protein [Gaiellales bacterium]